MKGALNLKGKAYVSSRTKKTLLSKQREGKKYVIWRISSKAQMQEIDRLGFHREPWLYEIKTRPFFNVRGIKSHLIKDIHFACKQGKRTIVRHLKRDDEKILKDFGVDFRPFKYRIDLTTTKVV